MRRLAREVPRQGSLAKAIAKPIAIWLVLVALATAQQAPPPPSPLAVQTTALPRAFRGTQYRFQLQSTGGSAPFHWEVSEGSLPKGVSLGGDGVLAGTPAETGEFHFTATVSDTGKPAQQRAQELVLEVVAPLMAEWSRYPQVSGQRIEGSVKISNESDQHFDLTLIALAVNETGRATALGYQHFTLKKDTNELEVPFGDTVPSGSYEIDVDVVAEVPAANTIHRARLVTRERLQVQPAP